MSVPLVSSNLPVTLACDIQVSSWETLVCAQYLGSLAPRGAVVSGVLVSWSVSLICDIQVRSCVTLVCDIQG